MITITARNLGPLAEGTVELRPLTIFVGPSNTGKSYMASAIYATAMAATPFVRQQFFRRIRLTEDPKEVMQFFREWARQQARKELPISELPVASLPQNVQEWFKNLVILELVYFRVDIVDQLRQLHGSEPGFVRQGSEPSDFQLSIHQHNPMLRLKVQLSDEPEPLPKFDVSQITMQVSGPELMLDFLSLDEGELPEPGIASSLAYLTVQRVFSELPPQIYYLPAARSGIVQGYKVLAAALTRRSRRIGLEAMNIPSLPGITTEFLGNLIELDKRRARRPEFTQSLGAAIGFIENSVLRGKIDLDESGGLPTPEIVYLPESDGGITGKFTLEHTSSMVSELAPLVLFLKYRINPGDLLILEEPESHLHPAAQRRIARGIARLVNAGVRVLITTHSDIIISQINNLLGLNQASSELVAEGGFVAEDFLREDQVGAYLFRYDQESGGNVIAPLEIDPDTGIDEDEFAAVFEAIYNESIALQRDRE